MNTTKLTREEALRRWNASKETKRKYNPQNEMFSHFGTKR